MSAYNGTVTQSDSLEGRMSRQHISIVFLAIACIALHATGCTVVGFTLGVLAEKNTPDYDTLHVWQVGELGKDDSVSVACKSNTIATGVYLGVDKSPSDQYRATYTAWQTRDSAGLLFPSLSDTVVVERTSPLRANVVGTLLGFDPGVICVGVGIDIDMVGVGDVRKVTSAPGRIMTGETLRKLLGRGRVPFMSSLLVGIGPDTLRIALYEISEIRKFNRKGNSWKGLLFGVAADIFIIAGLSSSLSGSITGGK